MRLKQLGPDKDLPHKQIGALRRDGVLAQPRTAGILRFQSSPDCSMTTDDSATLQCCIFGRTYSI